VSAFRDTWSVQATLSPVVRWRCNAVLAGWSWSVQI